MPRAACLSRGLTWVLRGLVSVLLLVAVGIFAHWPTRVASQGSWLRVSLRSTAGSAELCRPATAAELETLPAHMRRPEICDRVRVPYRLELRVDGELRLAREVHSKGLWGDRPMTFDELLPVPVGPAEVEVSFSPREPDAAGDATDPGLLERAIAGSPRYQLTTMVAFEPERITLFVLDGDDGGWRQLPAPSSARPSAG